MIQARLVSIIINNYNYGQYLRAAIDSALDQTYRSIEVIVVDDGSTDDSPDIIANYGDRVVAVCKKNGGQASALNAGFAHSHGDIVIFLDSDDILLPHTAEYVADTFDTYPDAAKVMYRMEVIDAAGSHTGIIKPSGHLPMRSGDLRQHVVSFPFDMTWTATSGNAFSAHVLQQIFPIPEDEYRILADFYLSHVTALFGCVIALDRVSAYYRVHGTNNHELSQPILNLVHIRRTIMHWRATAMCIHRYAAKLGLVNPSHQPDDILSVAYVANRLISLKLDPTHHPLEEDTAWRLLLLGIKASSRRFDVSLPMKVLFMVWLGIMVITPKPFAPWMAKIFSFPEERLRVNRLLKQFHR